MRRGNLLKFKYLTSRRPISGIDLLCCQSAELHPSLKSRHMINICVGTIDVTLKLSARIVFGVNAAFEIIIKGLLFIQLNMQEMDNFSN